MIRDHWILIVIDGTAWLGRQCQIWISISKLKIKNLYTTHNSKMGKKTGCTRPRATKSSKNKLTQKKTHSQKTSSLMYLNGSQTSPKSKNS